MNTTGTTINIFSMDGLTISSSDIEPAMTLAVKCVYGFFKSIKGFNVNVTHDDGEGNQRILSSYGDFSLTDCPINWSVCNLNQIPGNKFMIKNLLEDGRTNLSPLVVNAPNLRTYVGRRLRSLPSVSVCALWQNQKGKEDVLDAVANQIDIGKKNKKYTTFF